MKQSLSEKIEQLLPWGFIGIVISILFGVVALRKQEPKVSFEISTVINVLDVKRPLDGLSVLFKNKNIQDEKKNLQIVNFLIVNRGTADVRQADYDIEQVFGVKFEGAEIAAEPRVVYSNSKYLSENIRPTLSSLSSIEFNKLILETGKYAIIEVLLLHDLEITPKLQPLGKIAGQEEIFVIDIRGEKEPAFWEKVIQGGFIINLTRFIGSCVLLVIIIIIIYNLADKIHSINSARKDRKTSRFLDPFINSINPNLRSTFLEIISIGRGSFDNAVYVCKILADDNLLAEFIEEYKSNRFDNDEIEETYASGFFLSSDIRHNIYLRKELCSIGHLIFDDVGGKLTPIAPLILVAKSFLDFLENNPPPKGVELHRYSLLGDIRRSRYIRRIQSHAADDTNIVQRNEMDD